MKMRLHTVLFFVGDDLICKRLRSEFTSDPYFPDGTKAVNLVGERYEIVGLRKVFEPRPGELYVDVRVKGDLIDDVQSD